MSPIWTTESNISHIILIISIDDISNVFRDLSTRYYACIFVYCLFFVIIDCAPWMWKIISYYEFLSLYIVFVNSNNQRASIMSMVIFFFFIFLCACIFHNTDCLTDISFSSSSFSPPHHKSCARIFTQQQKNTLSCVFLCCVVVSNELQFLLLIFKSEITMKPTIS